MACWKRLPTAASCLSHCWLQVLTTLITVDVHNRDIVESLVLTKVSSATDFAWQMQLRYDYEAELEQVRIQQVNARCAGLGSQDPICQPQVHRPLPLDIFG